MPDTWIGAGGWGYFKGPSGPPIREYARVFRFVEVNTTFYRHPTLVDARRWRRSVPEDFRFSVKVHRSVTHGEGFRATSRALSAVTRDAAVARTLAADILVFETPSTLHFGRDQVRALRDFAGALGPGMRIALEARAYAGGRLPDALSAHLRDVGGIDIVDLARGQAPRIESDIAYTRLFGRGDANVWEFSDDELREIDTASRDSGSGRMVFAFHGVRMYKDAARFLEFRTTGRSPPATRARGVRGLDEVLAPDAKFPATREALIRDHGWKVVANEAGRNVHAAEYLRMLSAGPFLTRRAAIASLPPHGHARV